MNDEEIRPRPEVLEANRRRALEREERRLQRKREWENKRYAEKKEEIKAGKRAKTKERQKMREATKAEFIEYLKKHPQERFWQAVRNFSGFAFVLVSDTAPGLGELTPVNTMDTFYWEGKSDD